MSLCYLSLVHKPTSATFGAQTRDCHHRQPEPRYATRPPLLTPSGVLDGSSEWAVTLHSSAVLFTQSTFSLLAESHHVTDVQHHLHADADALISHIIADTYRPLTPTLIAH